MNVIIFAQMNNCREICVKPSNLWWQFFIKCEKYKCTNITLIKTSFIYGIYLLCNSKILVPVLTKMCVIFKLHYCVHFYTILSCNKKTNRTSCRRTTWRRTDKNSKIANVKLWRLQFSQPIIGLALMKKEGNYERKLM